MRTRNFIPKFMEPYTTGIGTIYDVGDYSEAMRRVLDAADYPALRSAQAARRASGSTVQTGIGLATYVEITSAAAPTEYGAVHLLADGRMKVLTGATPYGQGHVTTWKMIIADRLGVPMDAVDVVHGDTERCLAPHRRLTPAQVAGSSSSSLAADAARERAATLLEAAVKTWCWMSRPAVYVAGSPVPAVGCRAAGATGEPLVGLSDFKAAQPTCRSVPTVIVEVDTETGSHGEPPRRSRRCRYGDQSAHRRRSDPWRHRSRRRPSVARVDAVRRGRQSGDVELR